MADDLQIDPQLLGLTPPPPAASVAAPQQATTSKPGPVKGFLSSFLLGAGDAMRAHVGLETSAQQQERQQRQQVAQQQANTMEQYRAAQGAQAQAKADQYDTLNAPYTFGVDDTSIPEQFRGKTMTTAAAQSLLKVFGQNQGKSAVEEIKAGTAHDVADTKSGTDLRIANLKYGPNGGATHQVANVGGRAVLLDKRDGSVIKDLGASNALTTALAGAQARAYNSAKYGVSNVADSNGDPVAISRLQQLQSGAPTMTEQQTQNLAGDKVGVQTYLDASRNVERNIHVLGDPVQRAIIAKSTDALEHGGTLDAILQAAAQQGLSPEGAALIGGMKQMNEFGASFKKYTGNSGAATDSLRNTIHANQASAANSLAVNQQLIQQDRALAERVQGMLLKPTAHAPTARGAQIPATAPTSATDPFAAFGGKRR